MANKKIGSLAEFLLKLINSIFIMFALAMEIYGLYFLFKWKHDAAMKPHSQKSEHEPSARLLLAFGASNWLFEELPAPWFVYFIMAIGATLIIISCFGYLGTAIRSSCCLFFYFILLVGFILAQLGIAALVLFGHGSKKDLPTDKTGTLLATYQFVAQNWKALVWVALALLTIQVIALFLALYLLWASKGSDNKDERESTIYPDYLRQAGTRRSNTTTAASPQIGPRVQTMPKKTSS